MSDTCSGKWCDRGRDRLSETHMERLLLTITISMMVLAAGTFYTCALFDFLRAVLS
jgi:hypothetical protein